MRSNKKYIIVELDAEALDDLLTDALYYIECADTFCPPMPALVASAKATINAINKGDKSMNSNKDVWNTYKLALSKGEINAETYALLTADLPRGDK